MSNKIWFKFCLWTYREVNSSMESSTLHRWVTISKSLWCLDTYVKFCSYCSRNRTISWGSVRVKSKISLEERQDLVIIAGSLIAPHYIDLILKHYVVPIAGDVDANFVFIQTNPKPHAVAITKNFPSIAKFNPWSSGLNSIEHPWGWLERRVPRPTSDYSIANTCPKWKIR